MYNPGVGRFIQRDPIIQQDGSLFQYASSAPTTEVDPTGLSPTSALPTFLGSVTGKSYIRDFYVPNNMANFSSDGWGPRVGPRFRTNEDPQTDSRNPGDYRLFSKLKVRFKCCGDRIIFSPEETNDWRLEGRSPNPRARMTPIDTGYTFQINGGVEYWPLYGTIETSYFNINASNMAEVRFSWMVKGRPNLTARPLFWLINSRDSEYIWHSIQGRVYCKQNQGWIEASLSGSMFPSHRMWINGKGPVAQLDQGNLSLLWQSNLTDPTLVR